MYGTARVFVCRCALALALVLVQGLTYGATVVSTALPPLAQQIADGARITYASNGTPLASMARTYATGPLSGSTVVSEAGLLSTRAGNIGVNVARTVGVADAAAAIAVAGAAGIGVQVGGAISHALGNDNVQIGDTRCTASYSGWHCDQGTPPVVTLVTLYHVETAQTSFTPSGACSNWASGFTPHADDFYTYQQGQSAGVDGTDCHVTVRVVPYVTIPGSREAYTQDFHGQVIGVAGQPSSTCPAIIDALNPAWSRPAGGTPNADGKCATGQYTVPAGAYVADRVVQYGDKTKLKDAVQEIVEQGGTVPASEPTVTGPASKIGQPTISTTTNPDGTTSTTTSTPGISITYNGDTINYTENNTTTTVNNSTGATTTTTTEKPAEDKRSECEKSPDSAGCAKLGDPTNSTVPTSTVPVSITPVDLATGVCPASITWTAYGSHTFEFTPICNAAETYIKPVVLVIGAALAAFIFVGGLKS